MTHITIQLPDEIFERIRRDANAQHSAPEQIAANALKSIFATDAEPLPTDVAATIARLAVWVHEQPEFSVRPPLPTSGNESQQLDRDLDELISTIQQRARDIPSEQIERDVKDALRTS